MHRSKQRFYLTTSSARKGHPSFAGRGFMETLAALDPLLGIFDSAREAQETAQAFRTSGVRSSKAANERPGHLIEKICAD